MTRQCSCCSGDPDPNSIYTDLVSKIAAIYAAVTGSNPTNATLVSEWVEEGVSKTFAAGSYRDISFTTTGTVSGSATVNGEAIFPNQSIHITVPEGYIGPAIAVDAGTVVGGPGIRVDYTVW